MAAHRKNFDGAVEMYNRGLSIQDAASAFGVTRQSMWKVLKRRGVHFRPHVRFSAMNHFYRGGVFQQCNGTVTRAVARGFLIVGPCEVCGMPPAIRSGRQRIHGHHDDYNYPLKVRWLCQLHHHEWHKTNVPILRTTPVTPHRVIASMGGKASWKKNRTRILANLALCRAKRWGKK